MNIRSILPALSMAVVFSGHAADFSLTSQDIADNRPLTRREVFQGFGCEGGNTSRSFPGYTPPPALKATRSRSTIPMRRRVAVGGIGRSLTCPLLSIACQEGQGQVCLPVQFKGELTLVNPSLAAPVLQ